MRLKKLISLKCFKWSLVNRSNFIFAVFMKWGLGPFLQSDNLFHYICIYEIHCSVKAYCCVKLYLKKIHDGPEIFIKIHAYQPFCLSSFSSPLHGVLLFYFLRQDLILKALYSCIPDWIAYLSSALPIPMHFAHIKKLPWFFSFLRTWLMHMWSLTICRLTV